MRCRQVQRWLRANGPAAAAPARVCAHLADCATCRATQERLHRLAALLETTTPPEPLAGLRGRVLGALPDRPLVGWWAPRLLPAAGLAAALVFVLAPRGPSPLEVGAAELLGFHFAVAEQEVGFGADGVGFLNEGFDEAMVLAAVLFQQDFIACLGLGSSLDDVTGQLPYARVFHRGLLECIRMISNDEIRL